MASLAAVAVLVVACDYAEPARGPDGEKGWWAVHCHGGVTRCYAVAAEQCPHGYIIAGGSESHGAVAFGQSQGTVNGGSFHGTSTTTVVPTYRGDMLVKCKPPRTAESEWSPPASEVTRRGPDLSICSRAFEQVHDLANAWVEANPDREIREDLPARDKFMAACGVFSEEVQICLNASYLKGHRDKCQAAFDTTGERDWRVLDALFLLPEKGGAP